MAVVPAITIRLLANSGKILRFLIPAPEPREILLVAGGFLPAALVPFNVGFDPQNAGAFPAARDVLGQEGADVNAHAVVHVGMPADGLFGERFPAGESVVVRFTFQDELETVLELRPGM